MKINFKIGSFFLLSCLLYINLHGGFEEFAQEHQRGKSLMRPTGAKQKMKARTTNQVSKILKDREEKIDKWTSVNSIEGDERIKLLNKEFSPIQDSNPHSATQGAFLNSWFKYLNRVFFQKTYSPEKSKILKKFMNDYMKNVFKSFTGRQEIVFEAKKRIVENYCKYLIKELNYVARDLVMLMNSRTKKIKNWTEKEEWFRITGTWLVPYKKMQAKYEHEVTQYKTAFNKIVDTLSDMQVFLCTDATYQIALSESLTTLQSSLFSPEYEYAKTSITHAFIQLCLAWFNQSFPQKISFLERFFLKTKISQKEKRALENFTNQYRSPLFETYQEFIEGIEKLTQNCPHDCTTVCPFYKNIKTLFESGITKAKSNTSILNEYEKQNIATLINKIREVIDEHTIQRSEHDFENLQKTLAKLED